MGLCVWLMTEEIGAATFAGLAVIVVAIPLNAGKLEQFLLTFQFPTPFLSPPPCRRVRILENLPDRPDEAKGRESKTHE